MKNRLDGLEFNLETKFGSVDPRFRVLILCEDRAAQDQAMRFYKHLTPHIAIGRRLEIFAWDIKHPSDLEDFLETVTMADMIFVAGRDGSELSVELQNALDEGLTMRRVERGAFVALVGRANVLDRTASPLHSSLSQAVQGTGLNFFSGVYELMEKEAACTHESLHDRAERMTPTLARAMHNRVSPIDYGINE